MKKLLVLSLIAALSAPVAVMANEAAMEAAPAATDAPATKAAEKKEHVAKEHGKKEHAKKEHAKKHDKKDAAATPATDTKSEEK